MCVMRAMRRADVSKGRAAFSGGLKICFTEDYKLVKRRDRHVVINMERVGAAQMGLMELACSDVELILFSAAEREDPSGDTSDFIGVVTVDKTSATRKEFLTALGLLNK